jgi:hypothetical protein
VEQRVFKLSELQPPVMIEWTWHRDNRGSLIRRACIVEKSGHNLLTDDGDWLWWPTINHYNDVHVIESEPTLESVEI